MADIKTTLREVSVIVGIAKVVNKPSYDGTPASFVKIITNILPSSSAKYLFDILRIPSFDANQVQIIENGFNLADEIIEKFDIKSISEINWYGFDTQKEEPYDISINDIKFSLKEESFILENMGLYKLLNCYTGSKYSKRHIFKDYANSEYNEWFNVTWKEMIKTLKMNKGRWSYANSLKHKSGSIEIINNMIVLTYRQGKDSVFETQMPLDCSLSTFECLSLSKTREEVFSKFIKENLDHNERYNSAKKTCAVVASNNLAKELNDNLDYFAGLPRFLRIHKSVYYYAKTTKNGVEIYRVPDLSEFGHNIIIESVTASVPNKQANILTVIKNTKTGHTLTLRNECRFSHGQFNGTPEAKMYYENHGSLETIYEKM